ncbi:MAG: protease inhibitor I42 family protein [Deltaproteobacteria bacterium]|nr:protease inhibitor I42 family protein [Deltaproteobacteria bacterium]
MNILPVIFLAVAVGVSAPPSVKLSGKNMGQTVEMTVGGVLEIVLKGNPTTGYTWTVASVDEKILMQVGETEFIPDRKARGSGGRIVMRFEAAKVGKTSLNLIYHRPFEKHKPPLKTFEVKIIVD